MIRLLILILASFSSTSVNSQTTKKLVHEIRTEYKYIRENLKDFESKRIEIWNESTEGGEGVGYFDNGVLKLIEINWYGEMGKKQIEYYFNQNSLIFVFEQRSRYNRPIYYDEKKAKENGDNEAFDQTKTTVEEDRYYFNENELFLWLDKDGKEVDLNQTSSRSVEKKLLEHVSKVKESIK